MIFPNLHGKNFGVINLNEEGKKWLAEKSAEFSSAQKNPLIKAEICQRMVNDAHKKLGLDFSYGGWLEDRSFVWKDSYLEKDGTFIHLGIDINVPAGTEVAIDFEAEVVRVDDDYPEDGGWGPRVIVKHLSKKCYLIYAHLDRDIKCKVGDRLLPGQIFAKVGKPPCNGNWYEHLHVQSLEPAVFKEWQGNDFSEADGYGAVEDLELLKKNFKDPMKFIKF